MSKRIFVLLVALLYVSFLFAGVSSPNEAKKEEIRNALETYFFKGKLESDKKRLSEIIHEDYRLFNVHRKKLDKYTRADFFSWLGGKKKIKFTINSIDVTGGVAAVKVTEDAGKHMWIDYFNLVKIDGKWWIIDEVAYPLRK